MIKSGSRGDNYNKCINMLMKLKQWRRLLAVMFHVLVTRV